MYRFEFRKSIQEISLICLTKSLIVGYSLAIQARKCTNVGGRVVLVVGSPTNGPYHRPSRICEDFASLGFYQGSCSSCVIFFLIVIHVQYYHKKKSVQVILLYTIDMKKGSGREDCKVDAVSHLTSH